MGVPLPMLPCPLGACPLSLCPRLPDMDIFIIGTHQHTPSANEEQRTASEPPLMSEQEKQETRGNEHDADDEPEVIRRAGKREDRIHTEYRGEQCKRECNGRHDGKRLHDFILLGKEEGVVRLAEFDDVCRERREVARERVEGELKVCNGICTYRGKQFMKERLYLFQYAFMHHERLAEHNES